MKILIVYYSFTSNNEVLAKDIQQRLGCDVLKIETIKKRTKSSIFFDFLFGRRPKIKDHNFFLKKYDQIIFIAPMWLGRIASPLKTFLRKEKDNVRRYSFITASAGVKDQEQKIEHELAVILQKRPDKVSQLFLTDLLPEEQKTSIKYATGFRIRQKDLDTSFNSVIEEFLRYVAEPQKV